LRSPRVTVMSRSSRCCESSTATWNSSTGKSSSRCAKISKTSRGQRTGTPSWRSSAAIRRPSSRAAWIQTARAVPTPRTLVSVATGWVESSRNDPRQADRISWPMPSADRPSDPLPSRIASSSLELSACAPWLLNRSRGRSAAGSSRIVSVIRCSGVWSTDDQLIDRRWCYRPKAGDTTSRRTDRGAIWLGSIRKRGAHSLVSFSARSFLPHLGIRHEADSGPTALC